MAKAFARFTTSRSPFAPCNTSTAIEKALVVDCDVHHGNGTAAIFAGDRSVLTLSLHQFNNYPSEKPPSTIDVDLPDGVEDEEYLDRLGGALKVAMSFAPDLLIYVAGADPYREDQLGGLALTMDGSQTPRPAGV